MLIYIVKTNDLRYWHLYEFLKKDKECEYSNFMPMKNNINSLVLPMDGIDEFGYIKHTNLNLENIIKLNKIEVIYTGKVNKSLFRICQLNKIQIHSFYADNNFVNNELVFKFEVIKVFLEEKFSSRFEDINVLVLGNNFPLNSISKNLFMEKELKNNLSFYDAIINFSEQDLSFYKDKVIIEMNEISNIDLAIILNCKKIYFINQLLSQYLTKSGGKMIYDSMVKR